MRRVVVTGLGMVTPLACGVEPTWQRLIAGDSGARRIETLRRLRPRRQDRLPGPARRRHRTAASIPTSGWSRRSSARSTTSSSIAMSAADAGARGCRLEARRPTTSSARTGVMIGSGIGGLSGIAETAIVLKETRAAAGVAVLHSGPR